MAYTPLHARANGQRGRPAGASVRRPATNAPMHMLPVRMLTVGLLAACLLAGWASTSKAGKFNRVLSVGDEAPDFSGLEGVDDHSYALSDFKDSQLVVLLFTCNHCPVAQAYEERVIDLVDNYQGRDVGFLAISPSLEKSDLPPAMRERSEAKGYNFPYAHDADQAAAIAYGVRQTPSVFVLDGDRRIAYMGTIDDSWKDAKAVRRHYLRDALEALLAIKPPPTAETRPAGCAIEFASTDKKP